MLLHPRGLTWRAATAAGVHFSSLFSLSCLVLSQPAYFFCQDFLGGCWLGSSLPGFGLVDWEPLRAPGSLWFPGVWNGFLGSKFRLLKWSLLETGWFSCQVSSSQCLQSFPVDFPNCLLPPIETSHSTGFGCFYLIFMLFWICYSSILNSSGDQTFHLVKVWWSFELIWPRNVTDKFGQNVTNKMWRVSKQSSKQTINQASNQLANSDMHKIIRRQSCI